MTYFRVERHQQLRQNQLIQLASHKDIVINGLRDVDLLYGTEPGNELQAHIDTLFPFGMTEQGNWYFLNSAMSSNFVGEATKFLDACKSLEQAKQGIDHALKNSSMAIIEILFEYVRASHFSDKPSRFTSVFAWETLTQAKDFQRRVGGGLIWEVEGNEKPFQADMNLLSLGNSVLTMSYRAHRYWAGLSNTDTTAASCWEILLTPPVRVLRQMKE